MRYLKKIVTLRNKELRREAHRNLFEFAHQVVHRQQVSELEDLLIQATISDERTAEMRTVHVAVHLQREVRNEQYRLAEIVLLSNVCII